MKKRNIGYIVVFVVIVLACLWAFISAGIITRNFKEKIKTEDISKKEVDIENLLVTETKNGQKLWELFAENGHYDNKNNVALLNDIIGNFYEGDKVVASFKSSQGTYNAESKKIVLYSDTLIVYKDGSNVRANRIVWSGRDEDIVAQGQIRLEKPNQAIIYGSKAILKHDLSDFRIEGRTRTELYGEGNMKL